MSDAELELARACVNKMLAGDRASHALGLRVEVSAPGECQVRMKVTEAMVNGHGICHGGVIFSLADSAFAFACNAYNRVAVSSAASIDYLSPARVGEELLAQATEVHRGRRRGVYDVVVTAVDRTIALFRGTSTARREPMIAKPDDPQDNEL